MLFFTIFTRLLKLSTSKTVISLMNHKTRHVPDLKQRIWDSLFEETICKSVVDFRRRMKACVKADGHFKHLLK